MAPTDRVRALAEPLLAAAGLRLWDVEIVDNVVRVFVDRDGGVDLEALTDASRVMSAFLDEHDDEHDGIVPAGRYELEVSSPGLERVLRSPEHHRAYVGATVTVKTRVAVAGARRLRGLLVDADESGIRLLPDTGPGGDTVAIAYDQIERTRTVLDWGPAPKPGSRPKAASTRSDTADQRPAVASSAGHARDSKDRSR